MSINEDIPLLDVKLTKLKVEYEQYFMHILKREPLRLREDVDRLVRRYSNVPISNTGLKYKYQSLVGRYISYKQYWARTIRAIEEGTYVRRAEGGGARGAPPPEPTRSAEKPVDPGMPGMPGMEDIYKKYLDARKECSESTDDVSYERIQKGVNQLKKKAENTYGKDVEVKVYVKDGKATIGVVPKKK
ncbi:MAG: MXAN_5187 C-terminal domain-containing protein [Thermodesulfobacteriota bacterium]